ncbi:MAG: two-component sensor histidine kinase [Lachnospiraceae bacterium]|nr:two-component sensor histidine kinase [Lachnospiraceae bacterium]
MKAFSIKKDKISLKAFITVAIILTVSVLLWIFTILSRYVQMTQYKSQLIDDANRNTDMVADVIKDNGETDSYVKMLSEIYGGRVLIIDSDYKIIKDSKERNVESFIVSEKIIDAMTGSDRYYVFEEEGYFRFIKQVRSDSGDVEGLIVVHISNKNMNDIMDNSGEIQRIIFLVLIVVCIILAVAISRISVRDIRYINNQIDILQNGNLDKPIEEKGFKEYRNLIENYNDTIKTLAEIDTSRQEFVSNVSHELKTPITSMKVLADSLVQNENADLDMYKEFMGDIVDEIDRESKIINDLLTLVKMDKNSSQMSISDVSVNDLLDVILKRVTPIAEQRNIEITYESFRDVTAEVDEVKLSLALSNIIENAVKYNIDNGWVKVSLNADHKFFYVKVADSGVGIPDDCKAHVFERFYRVDKARSRDTGGTGLGLAITRNVIGMHNGTIKLYSESGVGTTFTIKIPLKQG